MPGFDASVIASRSGETQLEWSVVIPHYRYPEVLRESLIATLGQIHSSFEVIISDDASPDDSVGALVPLLSDSGRPFVYSRNASNQGFGPNLLHAISIARGRRVLLMGNDDRFVSPETLAEIDKDLGRLQFPEVAVTNFRFQGEVFIRSATSSRIPGGRSTVVSQFRVFAFFSGMILDGDKARANLLDTEPGIFAQVELASRLLAGGSSLGMLEIVAIDRSISAGSKRAKTWFELDRSEDSIRRSTIHADLISAVLKALGDDAVLTLRTKVWLEVLGFSFTQHLLEARRHLGFRGAMVVAQATFTTLLSVRSLRHVERVLAALTAVCIAVPFLAIPLSLQNWLQHTVARKIRARRIRRSRQA